VATLDTGIDYNHPDLSANVWRNTADCNKNGIDDDGNGYIDDCHGIDTANDDTDPMDDHNHGTHVAGTIGAVGDNGVGVVGVNWNVKIMACKFFDASGSATTEDAIECLDYVKTMKDRGVSIVATSNSWGDGNYSRRYRRRETAPGRNSVQPGRVTKCGIGQNNDTTPFYPAQLSSPTSSALPPPRATIMS
jgi:subtilisin family serine protease